MAYAYDIPISLAGGRRVDAMVHGHLIRTDQPRRKGGKDNDPAPLDLFLASIGTCAGLEIQVFCTARGLDADAIELTQHVAFDDNGDLSEVGIAVGLPAKFPAKYAKAIRTIVEQCEIERMIRAQPAFTVTSTTNAPVAAPAHAKATTCRPHHSAPRS